MGNACSDSQVCDCECARSKDEKTTELSSVKVTSTHSVVYKQNHDDIVLISTSLEKLSLSKEIDEDSSYPTDPEVPKNVLYYGWFIKEDMSNMIHETVMYYFKICYETIPQFQQFMAACCKENDIQDPFEYYKRPRRRAKTDKPLKYHTTAKFLGRLPDPDYQSLVHPFLDQTFPMHLIGIVFTRRTLGVRVKLSPGQQLIFDEKDESRTNNKTLTPTEIRRKVWQELDNHKLFHKRHKRNFPHCKLKLEQENNSPVIFPQQKVSRDPTTVTPTSRAHITIGIASKVDPKQTGDDLMDIVEMEQRSSSFQRDYNIERGIVRQFGKDSSAFVVYADAEVIVPAVFNSFI